MSILKLDKYGNNLGTRILGIEVKKEFDMLLSKTNEIVIVDFNNIQIVTSSFADELIGRNIQEYGLSEFKNRTKFINTNNNIKAVIKKSILDRMES